MPPRPARRARWLILIECLVALLVLADAGGVAAGTGRAAAQAPQPQPSGLSKTIGTPQLPQVVRVGTTLREVDPSRPTSLLPGRYRFTGVDAYELNTWWNVNVGCGPQQQDDQLASLFRAVGPGSVVRVWFFQAFGTNRWTGARDWTALDRTVSMAQAAGVRLVATLGNQDGSCDDAVWKSPAWYAGGYRTASPGQLESYERWVQEVATRYRSSPAILAWEPVNEPRPDTCTNPSACWSSRACPDPSAATRDLRTFYDQVGGVLRAADPDHLISDGAPPVGGCGSSTWAAMRTVDASPGIDLISYHDYGGARPLSSEDVAHWTALTRAVGKPLFAGENGGLNATPSPYPGQDCPLQSTRSGAYQPVIARDFAQVPTLAGWMFWDVMPGTATSADGAPQCDYATAPGDPLLGMLQAEEQTLNGR